MLGTLVTPAMLAETVSTARARRAAAADDSFVIFEPPSDERVDNSRGGASRPAEIKCIHDDGYAHPLTALLPQSGVGLTVAAHPTLLVYVPATTATRAHLTLRNADHSGLYQTQVEIPGTGGIVSLPLPADSPTLEVGKTYHWSLALLCQPTQTDMPITSGQIRRVELASAALAESQSVLDQTVTYGQSGVWHDMLTNLVQLRQTQPDNQTLNQNWSELLRREKLDAIANMPLLN
ncbi:hypothetical protein N836_34720 [Leptolyngbya sp. Heron Island J]|nr:hypothetical protein N836_34720 [Leptolyngbya sp. Heron Island J]